MGQYFPSKTTPSKEKFSWIWVIPTPRGPKDGPKSSLARKSCRNKNTATLFEPHLSG